MGTFLESVERLEKDHDDPFSTFYTFFLSIGEMDAKQVVAAYQAIKFYARTKGMTVSEHPLQLVWNAIVTRMEAILVEESEPRRRELKEIFSLASMGLLSFD